MRDIAMAEFALARRHVAAAMRAGRSSYPAILRYVRQRADVSEMDVFGAMLVMQKLGEIEMTRPATFRGMVELTSLWPGMRKHYRKNG